MGVSVRAPASSPVSRLSHIQRVPHLRSFATFSSKKDDVKKERVVILGSGWAGYTFARSLDPNKYERIIVSPRSYFVFTPLLASTAVGTLEFRTTLESVRGLSKKGGNVQFHQGWADDVDFTRKVIRVEENRRADHLSSQTILPESSAASKAVATEDGASPPPPPSLSSSSSVTGATTKTVTIGGQSAMTASKAKGPMTDVPYDKLVIAVGAYSQTFGIDGVRQHAHFLRDIGDARRIRLRVLSLFEQCTSPSLDDATRRRLLHFAIVGGGPTGIEFAAELHDLIHDDLRRIYPQLMPFVQVTVYDIAPKILPMFDQALANYATGMFSRQNIGVKTGHSIQRIQPDPNVVGGLSLKIKDDEEGKEVGAGMVVWSTGLMQNPLVEQLVGKTLRGTLWDAEAPNDTTAEYRLEKDPKTGGVITDNRFRARLVSPTTTTSSGPTQQQQQQPRLLQDVFVIGDCAVIDTQPNLPKTAQVASQQAAYLARALNQDTDALDKKKPFHFRNLGTMTYLGNWKAIHQSSADHLTGWAAWVLWRTAYLTRSMSLRNKLLIPVYWFVSWVFGRDISRF